MRPGPFGCQPVLSSFIMARKATPAPATATKTIVFLRSHPGYAYFAGSRAVLADEHAELLLAGGFAEVAKDEVTTLTPAETRSL